MATTDVTMSPAMDPQDASLPLNPPCHHCRSASMSSSSQSPTKASAGHRRRFSIQSHPHPAHHQHPPHHTAPTHHARSQSHAQGSFWSGSFKKFIKAITSGHGSTRTEARVHPWDENAMDQDMDGLHCNCGQDDSTFSSGLPPPPPPTTTMSSQWMRHKKRSNSIASADSSCSSTTKTRPGRTMSVGGSSIKSYAAHRRSSITSSIAGESIHHDHTKGTTKSLTGAQYRQHFTGQGPPPTTLHQDPFLKRHLAMIQAVANGSQPGSRRGSAFSTKSQETAVNLTGINAADEYEDGIEEEDSQDEEMEDWDAHGQDTLMEGHDEEPELYYRHHHRHRLDTQVEPKRRRRQSLMASPLELFPPPLLAHRQRTSPVELPEILHLIFQILAESTPADDYSQKDLCSCALVSKQWYLLAQKSLWREVRFKDPIKLDLFVGLLRRPEAVECLGIENSQALTMTTPTATTKKRHSLISSFKVREDTHAMIEDGSEDVESFLSTEVVQARLQARAPIVRKIVLHKLKLLEDHDILPMASSFKHLSAIEFYICEKLTDTVVMALADHCPQLQHLLMPGCAKVTDVGISRVAEKCPRMKHLDLRACSSVSDQSLLLVAKHCPDLWHLNVGRVTGSGKVTGRSIVEIAKNTNLNTLGLAGCAMTDEAVLEIARYSRGGLHRISLNSCGMLTSYSIRALMQLCPNLAVLEIKQCLLVTDMATLYRFASKRVLVELCTELQRRLVEYKVELAAAMNVAQGGTAQTQPGADPNTIHTTNDGESSPSHDDHHHHDPQQDHAMPHATTATAADNETHTHVMTTTSTTTTAHLYPHSSSQQQTTTTVVVNPSNHS